MLPDLAQRWCNHCKFSRIPDTKTVKEGKQRYVIYTCRMCKHNDIERWADRPRPKLWDGNAFIEDLTIDTDEDDSR